MPRYTLRTLLIVLMLGPPMLWALWNYWMSFDWAMLPVYVAALGIAGVALALALWFLGWARLEYERALRK